MKNVVNELRSIVTEFADRLNTIAPEELALKTNPQKWSRKEVIGHLIDSAQNNLRRFVVGQYDQTANIIYDQDFWVRANDYQSMKAEEIILLWKLLNERICVVLTNMPDDVLKRELNTGKDTPEPHSLEWFAADYVKHMKHHLNQVIPKSFDTTYP